MKILGRALLGFAPAALIAVSGGVITAPVAKADDEYFDNSQKAWVCRVSEGGLLLWQCSWSYPEDKSPAPR